MRFVPEDNKCSLDECANDLLCSRVISFGSSGRFLRDHDTFVIVLQIDRVFPSKWVKSIVHIEIMSEAAIDTPIVMTFSQGLIKM